MISIPRLAAAGLEGILTPKLLSSEFRSSQILRDELGHQTRSDPEPRVLHVIR